MKYYDIIPLDSVVYPESRCAKYDMKKVIEALQYDIEDDHYQWVFKPIEVIRYGKGTGLRTKNPPYQYQLINIDGSVERFCIIRVIGLHSIRAHIDTTFNDDGQDKGNSFPRKWRDNLGTPIRKMRKTLTEKHPNYKKEIEKIHTPTDIEKFMVKLEKKKLSELEQHYISLDKSEEPAKIAVILTSYNRPTMVQRAIKSVLMQDCNYRFKLYIVDNNSNVKTKTILKKYASKYPTRITLYFLDTPDSERLSKGWLSYMINLAIKQGEEEYITLLTDDCWMAQIKLGVMAKFLDNNPHVMICYGTQIIVNNEGRQIGERKANKVIQDHKGMGILDHNQVMFRRTLIDQVGCWNESPDIMGAPDADFWMRTPEKYPISQVTDYYLEHDKRFQKYFFRRGKKKRDLLKGELME